MHNSEDRGMMKWNAFHSVLSEDEVKQSIDGYFKDEKPDLSEDQIEEIENTILYAYNSKEVVKLTIFENSKIITKEGIITKLDPMHKSIYLDKKIILFSNIIKIESLNI